MYTHNGGKESTEEKKMEKDKKKKRHKLRCFVCCTRSCVSQFVKSPATKICVNLHTRFKDEVSFTQYRSSAIFFVFSLVVQLFCVCCGDIAQPYGTLN